MNEFNGNMDLQAIARAFEANFGPGSIGLDSSSTGKFSETARALFVRETLLSAASGSAGSLADDPARARLEARRVTRLELSAALGVDENEVFRLHHHAAGLLAKDQRFQEAAGKIRKQLERSSGIGA